MLCFSVKQMMEWAWRCLTACRVYSLVLELRLPYDFSYRLVRKMSYH